MVTPPKPFRTALFCALAAILPLPLSAQPQVFSASAGPDSTHRFVLGGGLENNPPVPDSVSLTGWWIPFWGGESTTVQPPDTVPPDTVPPDTIPQDTLPAARPDSLGPFLSLHPFPDTLASALPELRITAYDSGAGLDTAFADVFFLTTPGVIEFGAAFWNPDSFTTARIGDSTVIRRAVLTVVPRRPLANKSRYSFFLQLRDRRGNPATVQDTFFIAQKDTVPPQIFWGQVPETLFINRDFEFSFRAADTGGNASGIKEQKFFLRVSGDSAWAERSTRLDGTWRKYSLAGSLVTARGLDFYVRAVDSAGNVTVWPPDSQPATVGLPAGGLAWSAVARHDFTDSSWQMVTFPVMTAPLAVETGLLQVLGAYGAPRWRMLVWDGGRYVEYTKGAAFPVLRPGQGVWLYANHPGFKPALPAGTLVPLRREFRWTLHPGWNQTGSPFTVSLPWKKLCLDRSARISFPLRPLLPETPEAVFTLEPLAGSWVYNFEVDSVDLVFAPESLTAPLAKTSATSSRFAWYYRLDLAAGTRIADRAFWGQWSQAGAPADNRRFLKPPAPEEQPNLSFLAQDGNRVQRLAAFFHAPAETALAKITLVARVPDRGRTWALQYSGSGLEPACVLFNDLTLEAHSLTASGRLPLPWYPGLDSLAFTLLSGSAAAVEQEVQRKRKDVPPTAYLRTGFPNPFNPVTRIPYGLPLARAPWRVILSVYNIKGELTERLREGILRPGMHEITWNGRNFHRQPVANGIYFIRLQARTLDGAQTFKKTGRAILLK
jgi:hypothetical protein